MKTLQRPIDGYDHVLPRDGFNDANLIKNIAKLVMLIEDGFTCVNYEHDTRINQGFTVVSKPESGETFIQNVRFYYGVENIYLFRPLNSRWPWPLYFHHRGFEGEVFYEDGTLTRTWMERFAQYQDPTRLRLLKEAWAVARNHIFEYDRDFIRMEIEYSIYWFCHNHHGGQWSNLYSVLSTSKYRPSPLEKGVDEDSFLAIEIYRHFKQIFTDA